MGEKDLSVLAWEEIKRREYQLKIEIEERMASKGSYSVKASRIDPVKPEEETEEVREILDEIKRLTRRSALAVVYYVWAHMPALLRGKWVCLKAIMFEGILPKALKESISIVIARGVGCKS